MDLFSESIDLIPLHIYQILLQKNPSKNIKQIIALYEPKEQKIILEYIDYLVLKKYIKLGKKKEMILINNKADTIKSDLPYRITNCVIEIGKSTIIDKSLQFLKSLIIPSILVQITYDISIEELSRNISKFHETCFTSIEIHIGQSNNIDIEKLKKLFNIELRIFRVVLFNQKETKTILKNDILGNYIYSVEDILNKENCGVINPSYFVSNRIFYNESQRFNTCLNKKIAIDENGLIRNCPSIKTDFGNIENTTVEKIITDKKFNGYWKINKETINVCKTCEFRHVCTDCRVFIEDPEDILSKPLKCGYDPYTGKWEQWSENPLKQKAIKDRKSVV